ncbi:MAG: hypothetical protein H7832_08780 [Magnetococcus sp. DMHC-6]
MSYFRKSKKFFVAWGVVWVVLLGLPTLSWAGKYRQPAYLINTYFSDKVAQGETGVKPISVVKAFQLRSGKVTGYFVLDLLLADPGTHLFQVDIIDAKGSKITTLSFDPVQMPNEGVLPIFTAAGAVSGAFASGIWFFKVMDTLDKSAPSTLGTYAIQVLPDDGTEPVTPTEPQKSP